MAKLGGRQIHGSAEFAEVNGWKLRMRLDRWWDDRPRALVCMANPSTAGADKNDPTIWQLLRLCELLDVGGFSVVNWEPYIATDPDDLHRWRAAASWNSLDDYTEVRAQNTRLIRGLSDGAKIRLVAWGNLVPRVPHTTLVLRCLSLDFTRDLYAFGLTGDGAPKHPMARGKHRISADAKPILYRPYAVRELAALAAPSPASER